MRFSLYTIVLWVSLLLSLNVSAQTDWQIIKYEDFEGVHRGGGWLTTTHQEGDHFMPVIHANSNAGVMAFQPADSSPFTLTNMPKIGFVVDLSPDYEYRFSADVATLLGQDMGIFISPVSVTGNTTTLLDATQTQLINTGGGGGLQSNWNPHLNTDVFTVDQAGVYFIYLQPTASQLVYTGLGVFYTTYDLYDNIKLEAKLTALPTTVSFIDHSISVSEGSTATICVEIEQPHANEETQVAIELTSPEEPHFTGIEPLTVTFPAGEVSEQCVDIDIPITSTSENSFFYDFNLLNTSSNEHAVVIGNDSELSLFVTKKNILNISSATQLSVAEGEMMEVCVSLSQSSPSFTSVSLYAMANASPHFINNLPVSFVLPPGQTELCQSIQVPFASTTDNQSYQLQLQNISGTNVAIGSTNELEVEVIPSTLSECWEESINQGFSSNSSLNFSNEPDVVNHGFRKKNYGASGSYNDICAYVSNITGYYIGLKSYLEANKAYRLSCDIRTTSYDKELELYIGTSVASANVVSGSYHINASSSWQSLDMETFTVDADGEYVIFLKKAAGTAGGGTTKLDNFILEKDCTPYPTEVFFTQESYSVSEGGQVAICVDINNASADESTSVDVVFDNTHLPHFTNSSYTLNFPAASNQAQCVNLSIPVNGNLDGNISYPISLGNIISGAPAQIGAPASAVIEVQDDISYDDCNTWTEAVNDNIDNYYLLLPSNAFETSSSINLNNYYYLDYAGDKSIGGPYSTSFYVALHFDMQPNYEYRLKWDAKGIKKGSPLSYPDKVAQLMETKFGENRTSATLLDSSPAAATGANQFQTSVVSVNSAGSYTFVIEGGSSSSQTDIDLDNFILERRCIRTGVSIDIPASGLYTATEGETLEVCLNISAPSISQATEVTLEFVGESAPHFPAEQSYIASFPAGSTAQACVQIPTMIFGGADSRSAYQIAITDVSGGVDAQAVDPTQANVQILDQTNCWNSLASENFSGANYSLTNVSDLVNNYSARRFNYGASGSYSDLCARMRLRSGKYIGFRKYLEAGKSYRQQWALKQETAAKEMFFAVGTSGANMTQIGHAFTVPVLSNTETAMVVQSEYFTVPTSGYYYLVLRSNETNYNYTRFDDFELQERCPSAEVNFTQTDIYVQEGYPAQVCVRIDNPSATENTTATIAFANTQTPHFANSSPQIVTFLAGETQEVCITIPTVADGLINDQNSYELILTDASGNHYPIIGDENTLTIHIIDDIDLSTCEWAGSDQTICFGNTVQLGTDDLEWPCYSEKYCFNWVGLSSSNGGTDQMPTVFPWQTTDYIVFVTDGEGHVFSDTVTVTVNHAPMVGITTTDDFLCHGEEATLGLDVGSLSEPLSFEWSTGDVGGTTTISQGGTYVLTVTDSDGCTSQSSIEIEQKEWPYELSAKSTFICEDRPSTILSIEGASIPATTTTTWSTGETDNEIAVSQAGTYSVAMHDTVNGCDTTLTYTILDVDEDLALNLSTTTGAICPESNLTITANIAGLTVGEEEVTYLWNTGVTTSSITIDEPGTYTVTVNFNEDCSLGQEIIITDDVFDFDIVSESGESFACPISPLTLMTQTTAGEISEWQWSTGEQSSTISVTSTDTYELSVTNVNGCVYTDTYSTTDCPTLISFSASEVEMAAGEEIEICLELANPNDQAASVDVLFADTQSPHFTDIAASRQIDFAVGETYKCFMLQAQNIEDAPEESFYQLQLANTSGGYQASIKEPSELAIKVENLIRCEVFQDSSAVNCALTDSTIIVTDIPLIQVLKEGDSFWAGDFEVEVQQATGSSVFNGEGVIRVPYFEQVQVNVRLDNVKINEACQMVEGEVIVEGVGAKLLSDEILDALNDALETLEDIDDALGVIDEALSILEEALGASEEMSNVLSEDWNVWQGSGPIQEEYPLLPDSVLNQIDEALLCYLTAPPAECNENLSQTIANLIQEINALFEADYAIRFSAYEEQAYGFDSLLYNQMSADYNKLTVAAKPYNVAWKSVEAGEADHVMVDKVFAELPTDLSFENNSQELILHSEHDGGTRLPVQSLGDEEIYQIYPVQTKQDTAGNTVKKYAGKLNVISYEDKPVDVVLVPVNNAAVLSDAQREIIENQLNAIYKPAVASFTVSLHNSAVNVPSFTGTLDTTESAFYTVYNAEMKRIIRKAKDISSYNSETYYILLVNAFDDPDIKGFMPKGKQFGFVATDGISTNGLARTIAHELGHGAFWLNHISDEYELEAGSTENLMDIGDGVVLNKYQWDIIHDPSLHISLFDSDEEAQSVTVGMDALARFMNEDGTYTVLAPSGKPFTLAANLQSLTFATGDDYAYNGAPHDYFRALPFGTVTHYELLEGDETILYTMAGENTFSGYYRYNQCTPNCTGEVTKDAKTVPYDVATDKAIIGFPFYDSSIAGGVFFEIGQIAMTHSKVDIDSLPTVVPSNYTAYGGLKPYDFLVPEVGVAPEDGHGSFPPFIDTIRSEPIQPGGFSHQFNQGVEPILFLKFWEKAADASIAIDGPGQGSLMAPYLFLHAQQLAAYPGFFGECTSGNYYQNVLANVNTANTGGDYFFDPVILHYNIKYPEQYPGPSPSLEDFSNAFKQSSIAAWQESDASIYKEFSHTLQTDVQDAFFASLDGISDPELKVNTLEEYLEKWATNPCLFRSLSIANRLKALEIFTDSPEFMNNHKIYYRPNNRGADEVGHEFVYNQDLEYLINHLLKATPDQEGVDSLLNFFFGEDYQDPSNYFRIAEKMNDVQWESYSADPKGYPDFIAILTNWIFQDKYINNLPNFISRPRENHPDWPHAEYFPQGKLLWSHSDGLVEEDIDVHYIGKFPGCLTPSSGFCNSYEMTDFEADLVPEYEAGKIKLTSSFEFRPTAGVLFDEDDYFPYESENIRKPEELVALRFVSDYDIPMPNYPDGVKRGDTIIVPTIYAELLLRQQNNAELDRTLSSTANVLGLALGVATLGTSTTTFGLAMGVADIAYTAIDETIMAPADYEHEATGGSWISQETRKGWNNIGLALLVGSVGELAYTGGKFIVRKLSVLDGVIVQEVVANMEHYDWVLRHHRNASAGDLLDKRALLDKEISFFKSIQESSTANALAKQNAQARIRALQLEQTALFPDNGSNSTYFFNYDLSTDQVRIHNVLDNAPNVGTNSEPIGVLIPEDETIGVFRINQDNLLTQTPTSSDHIIEMKDVKVVRGDENVEGLAASAKIYRTTTNTGELVYKVFISNADFLPLSNIDSPWFLFMHDSNRNWTSLWSDYFEETGIHYGGGVVAGVMNNLAPNDLAKMQSHMTLWTEAQTRAFLENGDQLEAYFLRQIEGVDNTPGLEGMDRVKMWGTLYHTGQTDLIEPALLDRFISKYLEKLNLIDDINSIENGARAWKAINRVHLNGSSLADDLTAADFLEELLLTQRASAHIATDGSVILKTNTLNGTTDDIAHIINGGDLNYNQQALNDGLMDSYRAEEVIHISENGLIALVRGADNKCELVQGACFPANTPIQIPNATKAIQDIAVGDIVVAYDEIQQDTVLARVKNTFTKQWHKMVQLVVGQDTLLATTNHPFYIPSLTRYLQADSIRKGMQLLALTGTLLTVQSVAAVDTAMTVYNFEVEEQHNYFVGQEGVLVHNDCIFTKAGLKSSPDDAETFDLIDEVINALYPYEPQRSVVTRELKQNLVDNEALLLFMRADGVTPPTGLSIKDVRESRLRAWEVLRPLQSLKDDLDILTLVSNWSADKVQALRNTIANASDNAIARLDNVDILNAWERLFNGGFQVAVLSKIDELFDANGVPRIVLKEGDPVYGEVDLTLTWNGEEITQPFRVIYDPTMGGLRFRFRNFVEEGRVFTFPISHPCTKNLAPERSPTIPSSLNPKGIKLMQVTIRNDHDGGPFFVLKNAYKLRIGGANGMTVDEFFPPGSDNIIQVWKNLAPDAPGVWSVDHRRLVASILGDVESIPVRIIEDVESITYTGTNAHPDFGFGHAFKMSTESEGVNINLIVHMKDGKFVHKNTPGKITEEWRMEKQADNSYKILRQVYGQDSFIEVPFYSLPDFWD